ncbi:helix-turn-helix domain-containing protein [Aestuariispira insulae]|uniref:Transcriptional regulator with XRE-family HTH domain n=1 Tax=Aestuariispira insulae TaxID=1461337 RepID=A0A3D9HXE0_9PROT|nr:helix-turn-helix transcriptional regulator [Aestuariispira insulae]RED54041.1 transcriptional regulator with XRE-family HTH domain [Aestuariispira insulae]
MAHPTDIYVGAKVREARMLKGFSQERLAERLGISFQQVQKYEKGSNRIGCSRLWDISVVLETPVTFFFNGLEGEHHEVHSDISPVLLRLAKKISDMPGEARRPFLAFLSVILEDGPHDTRGAI